MARDEYITYEEAAALLGVSRRTIERYVEQRRLKRYRRQSRNYVKRSEVEQLQQFQPDGM